MDPNVGPSSGPLAVVVVPDGVVAEGVVVVSVEPPQPASTSSATTTDNRTRT
jgi:hypothetical protein